MASNNICNPELRLDLGLGLNHHQFSENCMKKKKEEVPSNYYLNKAYPSLTLGPPNKYGEGNNNEVSTKTESEEHFHPQASSPSAVSNNSFSNTTSSTINKRERNRFEVEEFEIEEEKILSRDVDVDEDENGNPRKKLRLNKEQSAVLEHSFKEHSTLNPSQKQELARKLNLRARQVEVWFQNRRARSKLKQTEVDYELLKKYSEDLREENKRLQKELQELKSMKTAPPPSFYMQLPAVTSLTICPSCNRMCGGNDSRDNNASSPSTAALLIGTKAHNHHLYKNNYPFAQSSATC